MDEFATSLAAESVRQFSDAVASAFEEAETMNFTGAEVATLVRKLSEDIDSDVRKAIDTLDRQPVGEG